MRRAGGSKPKCWQERTDVPDTFAEAATETSGGKRFRASLKIAEQTRNPLHMHMRTSAQICASSLSNKCTAVESPDACHQPISWPSRQDRGRDRQVLRGVKCSPEFGVGEGHPLAQGTQQSQLRWKATGRGRGVRPTTDLEQTMDKRLSFVLCVSTYRSRGRNERRIRLCQRVAAMAGSTAKSSHLAIAINRHRADGACVCSPYS
jgi:hypothetical protein